MWPITGLRISTEKEEETVDNNIPGTAVAFRSNNYIPLKPRLLLHLVLRQTTLQGHTYPKNKEENSVVEKCQTPLNLATTMKP